jgi:hypothetical protein
MGTISLPNDLHGIAHERLSVINYREISAVIGERQDSPLHATTERILAHHRLIRQISDLVPTLPVQFGSSISAVERLKRVLEEQYETLVADLDRLAGKVEFGVTIVWDTPEVARSTEADQPGEARSSGADYMRQKLSVYQRERELRSRASEICEELSSNVEALVVERHEQILAREDMPVRAAYLVGGDHADRFRAEIEAFSDRYDELDVVLVGPWPPYSFVTSSTDDLAGMFGAMG